VIARPPADWSYSGSEEHVQNLLAHYSTATPAQHAEGTGFYPQAHQEAVRLARQHPDPSLHVFKQGRQRPVYTRPEAVQRAAGAIAALSPAQPAGMSWEHNVPAAHVLARTPAARVDEFRGVIAKNREAQKAAGQVKRLQNAGADTGDALTNATMLRARTRIASQVAREPLTGGLQHASNEGIVKAYDIWHGNTSVGDAFKSVSSQKTRRFAKDITAPRKSRVGDLGGTGTIDKHMHNVITGKSGDRWVDTSKPVEGIRNRSGGRVYNALPIPELASEKGYLAHNAAVHEAARRVGIRPNDFQAVVWVHEKARRDAEGKGRRGISKGV
jgi:hypothetical protein